MSGGNNNNNNDSKKTLDEKAKKNVAKTLATSYAGPIGGMAVDSVSDKINDIKNKRQNIQNNNSKAPNPDDSQDQDNKSTSSSNELQNEDLEKENKENKSNKDNKNNELDNKNDIDSQQLSDGENQYESFGSKVKKIPSYIKYLISIISSTILVFFAIILGICLVVVATTAISEKLYLGLRSSGNAVTNFFKNAANFFATVTGSTAESAEQSYYNKLNAVYDEFKEKYGVSIDTTLITATLFYGRTMGDYIDEDFLNSEKEIEDIDDDNIYEGDSADSGDAAFYRVAKRHIRTLAKYMLYQDTNFNKCVPDDEVEKVAVPETMKEVAESWTTVSIFTQYNNSIWNSINNFNYEPYRPITFTNVDGKQVTIEDWCKFEDAHKKLQPHFEYDQKIYLEKKHAYEVCREGQVNACKSGCGENDYNCYNECDNANFEACATQKSEYDKVARIFHENWTNEGLYDEDGNFTCKWTSKWGPLGTYDDEMWFYNHMFDKDLKNKAIIPNFLEKYSSYIGEKIECSAEPAISYVYDVDTSEEGIYYYKLMTKTTGSWFNFQKEESFIERYYKDLLPDNYDELSEDEQYESQKKIVDEIFLLYYTATFDRRNDKYCYTPGDGNNTGVQGDGLKGIPNGSTAEFIEAIAPLAVSDMQASGISASITIAQAVLESSTGKSGLAKNYNNFFGMTAGSCAPSRRSDSQSRLVKSGNEGNNCTGNAFWNGDVVWMCNKSGADCQWYRVYNSVSNSLHDHSRLLSNSHYNCQGLSSEKTIACVKRGGYATDPGYEAKVLKVVNTYNLTQYDIGEWAGEPLTDYGSEVLGTVCYSDQDTRDKVSEGGIENGEGTVQGIINGERMKLFDTPEYTVFWKSKNNLFYASNPNLLLQCTWYAHGRALEILTSNGMSLADAKKYLAPMHGNAGLWFGQNKYFSSSTAVASPKPGAIVVWSKSGQPGHVAIVESVKYDSSGRVTGVSLSEGGKSINGFRYTPFRDLNYISSHGSYRFVGYVYLLG